MPRRGQSFAFVMDTAPCPGAEELADGVDLLVTESTFSDDDAGLAAQYRHLTAGQAGALASAARAGTLVLTHFSSRYVDVEPLARQARARAGSVAVVAANDLDRVAFPKRRREAFPAGTVPRLIDENVDPVAVVGVDQHQEKHKVEEQVDADDVGQGFGPRENECLEEGKGKDEHRRPGVEAEFPQE